jgi:molybdate transport system substrate-binding protein
MTALFLAGLALFASCSKADETLRPHILVAVSSNFQSTLEALLPLFEAEQGCTADLVVASTGILYAQIRNGAPYDVFLAADTERPELLDQQGVAIAGSRFTYAHGKLVLWSRKENYFTASAPVSGADLTHGANGSGSPNTLQQLPSDLQHFAIANPKLAPYGRAAEEVLRALGLWDRYEERLVRGENIGHTFQYVYSGNAEVGLLAYSQLQDPAHPASGSFWVVPEDLYAPIEQQAVLLTDQANSRAFLDFLRSPEAQKIMHKHGYGTP